jgi:hypothetical protein
MIKFLGRLFGSEKAIERAFKIVDSMKFTEQEKAEASQKILDWQLQMLSTTGGQHISRRIISLATIFVWLGIIIADVVFYGMAMTQDNTAAFHISEKLGSLTSDMWIPVSLIMLFYFAPNKIGEALLAFKRK